MAPTYVTQNIKYIGFRKAKYTNINLDRIATFLADKLISMAIGNLHSGNIEGLMIKLFPQGELIKHAVSYLTKVEIPRHREFLKNFSVANHIRFNGDQMTAWKLDAVVYYIIFEILEISARKTLSRSSKKTIDLDVMLEAINEDVELKALMENIHFEPLRPM